MRYFSQPSLILLGKQGRTGELMGYAIFFATVIDSSDGLFVDSTYFGGVVETQEQALQLGKDITNDRNLPGVIIPKIVSANTFELGKAQAIATKYFNNLAKDIYEVEEAKTRRTRVIGV